MLFANSVRILFIKGDPVHSNGPRKFRKNSSSPTTFLIVCFSKIHLFFKDLITVIISFISLFFTVAPKPSGFNGPFLNTLAKCSILFIVSSGTLYFLNSYQTCFYSGHSKINRIINKSP